MKKSMLERMTNRAAEAQSKEAVTSGYLDIPLDKIRFNPNQPRKDFYPIDGIIPDAVQAELKEFAAGIAANGLMHPIIVREVDGGYEIVVGERRTRAALLLDWKSIPGQLRNDLTGGKLKAFQLAENIDRSDLTEIDIALHIQSIVNDGEISKQDLGKQFNKPASWVTRYLSFADPINYTKWVEPGYIDKAWILYALIQLPQDLQDEALEICRERKSPLKSSELKQLEARAKHAKEAAAQKAAASAVAPDAAAQPQPTPPASVPGQGPAVQGTPSGDVSSSSVDALFGDRIGDDGGYRPNQGALAELRGSPPDPDGFKAPSGYANDDAARDLSGHEPVANMHRMPQAATSTVTSRVSLNQLVALQQALVGKDIGTKTSGLAVEFRADEALLRAMLAELGVDASELPASMLTLKLSEVAQGLVKGA